MGGLVAVRVGGYELGADCHLAGEVDADRNRVGARAGLQPGLRYPLTESKCTAEPGVPALPDPICRLGVGEVDEGVADTDADLPLRVS
jgi:hypothetical protein